MDTITLPWMNKIRTRLNEPVYKHDLSIKWSHNMELMKFLRPIMEYGKQEENRIIKSFIEGDVI